MKQKAITGVKWTTLSKVVVTSFQLIYIAVLARYLSPVDFGLMAIVMVVIGFSQAFMDMGISNAIIYKQGITDEQLSSLYWLNIGSGVVLAGFVILLSPLIADFYNQSAIEDILVLLSLTFIITAIGNQYRILFQKELRFNILAKIEIVSAIASLVVAVYCAMNDFGVYALVNGSLTTVIVSSSLVFITGIKEHKPAFVFHYAEIKGFINFGLYQMAEKSVNYFSSQFDILLIGKLLGAESLGIYSLVKQLVMRPSMIINPIVTQVAFPLMSKVQDDTEQLKSIYLKMINSLSSINFPIHIAMAILAEAIVVVLFGDKWITAVPILQILSIYAMLRSTGNPIGALLLAKGRADLGFWWNFALFFIIIVVIYMGSSFGLKGIAWSLLLLQVVLSVLSWYFLVNRLCSAGFLEYYKQILNPLFLATISGAIGYSGLIITDNYLLQITSVSVIGLIVYVILSMYFNRGFVSMIKAFK